ncbi:MAG: helix-turn-helix domain-containing protein [Christensenellales bacterium]
MTIGDRIRVLRKVLKLNQEEFGARIKAAQPTIGNYETGFRAVPERTQAMIVAVYGVSPRWLRDGEGPMFPERTKEERIAEWVGRITNDPDENAFLIDFIIFLSERSPEELALMKQMIAALGETVKEKG